MTRTPRMHIITVGTSQIDREVVAGILRHGCSNVAATCEAIAGDDCAGPGGIHLNHKNFVGTLVGALTSSYRNAIGANGSCRICEEPCTKPFLGAELSMLDRLLLPDGDAGNDKCGFAPQTDHIRLIASQTCSGQFCAEVVLRFCRTIWPDTCSKVIPLDGLYAEPDQETLAATVWDCLKELSVESKALSAGPVFHILGGYKYMIPYMTVMAMITDGEACYAFKKRGIQWLHPVWSADDAIQNCVLRSNFRGADEEALLSVRSARAPCARP